MTLCTPLPSGKNVRQLNCADKYILIELSDLIGFVHDLSGAQDGFTCLRMGFIFCGKHHLLMTKIQVSDQGPMCPLVLSIDSHMKKPSGMIVDLKGAVCTIIRLG